MPDYHYWRAASAKPNEDQQGKPMPVCHQHGLGKMESNKEQQGEPIPKHHLLSVWLLLYSFQMTCFFSCICYCKPPIPFHQTASRTPPRVLSKTGFEVSASAKHLPTKVSRQTAHDTTGCATIPKISTSIGFYNILGLIDTTKNLAFFHVPIYAYL